MYSNRQSPPRHQPTAMDSLIEMGQSLSSLLLLKQAFDDENEKLDLPVVFIFLELPAFSTWTLRGLLVFSRVIA